MNRRKTDTGNKMVTPPQLRQAAAVSMEQELALRTAQARRQAILATADRLAQSSGGK